MSKEIDIEEFIHIMPAGTAVYHRTVRPSGLPGVGSNDTFGIKTDFIVKERTDVIRAMGKNPPIALVAGLIYDVICEVRAVCLAVVMFRLGEDESNLYEVFFNYYESSGQAPEIFRDLATQDTVAFHMHGDNNERIRSIVVANQHQEFWTSAINKLSSLDPWAMEEFDVAKERIFRRYSNPLLLYRALEKYLIGS